MTKTQENIVLIILSTLTGAFLLWLSSVSPGLEGGMDSYNHYLIAKNSWSHPALLLDYWGKPIYNLIASPFAQMGIKGMVLLNIICLLLSSYLAYSITKKLKLQFAWLAFVLTLFSPIFLDNTISSLTEPLCALLVILTIYFIVNNKWMFGGIVAGLLPFARSEGFIILGVVFVYFLLKKANWKVFLSLLAGSVFFNVLGWSVTGEPLWVITQNPYINFELSGRNVCGSGGIAHYLWAGHYTFGFVTCLLLLLGAVAYLRHILKNKTSSNLEIGLIVLSFCLYFAAHVFIWWRGMMGSCGYVRVMTVIAPLGSIIAVYGIHYFSQWDQFLKQKHSKSVLLLFTVFVSLNAMHAPFRYYSYKYPLAISEEQAEYEKLAEWYKKQGFEERTKLYLYPYFSIIANIDPYNQDEHLELWKSSLEFTKKGDILIWDVHFGPNESNIPLDSLRAKSEWKEIHSIIPQVPIPTLNNANFEIHVFEKMQ